MSLISAATSRETIGVGLSASILIVIGATIVLLLTVNIYFLFISF
jgi:hypothetical protein